jgi:hypothetical protein
MKRFIRQKTKIPKGIDGKTSTARETIGEPKTRAQLLKIAKAKKISVVRLPLVYKNVGQLNANSRLDQFFKDPRNPHSQIITYFAKFRAVKKANQRIPKNYLFPDPNFLMKRYKLRGIEYGKWVSQEDRFNLTSAIGLILHDLRQITGIKNEAMGAFGRLIVALGSRGRSSALAHFSPSDLHINITRHREDMALNALKHGFLMRRTDKVTRYLNTSGINSFAHEYGHLMDFVAANYLCKKGHTYCSQLGRENNTVAKSSDPFFLKQKNINGDFERFFKAALWSNEQAGRPTLFVNRLEKNYPVGKNQYLHRRKEIWARCFEQWVFNSLKAKGIYNEFLQPKYEATQYPDAATAKKIAPYIAKIVKTYATLINQHA